MTISDKHIRFLQNQGKESSLKEKINNNSNRNQNHSGNDSELVAIWLGTRFMDFGDLELRMVQEYICQMKKKYLLKKNCKKQSRSWDCIRGTAGLDRADYLSLETESLSALRGRGRLSSEALLSDAPSPRIHLQIAVCEPEPALPQSLTFPWRVQQLYQQNLSLRVGKDFSPLLPFLFFSSPLNQKLWMKANQRELAPPPRFLRFPAVQS